MVCSWGFCLLLVPSPLSISVLWLPSDISVPLYLYTCVLWGPAQPWLMEEINHETKQTIPSSNKETNKLNTYRCTNKCIHLASCVNLLRLGAYEWQLWFHCLVFPIQFLLGPFLWDAHAYFRENMPDKNNFHSNKDIHFGVQTQKIIGKINGHPCCYVFWLIMKSDFRKN